MNALRHHNPFSFFYLLLIFCILLQSRVTVGQDTSEESKKSLEEERQSLRLQIEDAKKQLEKIKSNKKTSLMEIALLQKKINLRSQKVALINREILQIEKKIETNKHEISTMQMHILKLKGQYKKSILAAYKNYELYNPSYFLFSSTSFSSFIDRMYFLKKFREIRMSNLNAIAHNRGILESSIKQLSQTQAAQSQILNEQREELVTLKSEEVEKKNIVKQLKTDEQKLAQQIAKKTKRWKNIKKAIELVIKKEIERNKKRMEEERRVEMNRSKKEKENNTNRKNETKPVQESKEDEDLITNKRKVSESSLTYSDKDFNLAKNFQANKGKLPWPVENPVVTMKFGKNKVTDESRITYDNSGLTIQIEPNTPVKSIFSGSVTNIQEMEDGFLVTIRHGQFWSIYIPIQNLMIQTGQEVRTGQVIGFSTKANPSELEFQILKETSFQNPEHWLKK